MSDIHRGDYETWAAGYASTPIPVDDATWTRWRREIESYAHVHGLRLAGVFTDRPPAHGQSAGPGAGRGTDPELRKLVGLIRERAHLRVRHISRLLVPSIQHLAPGRDGTQDIVRNLLELHFGLRVEQVVIASTPASITFPRISRPRPPRPGRSGAANGTVPISADPARNPHALTAPGAADEPAADHVNPPIAGTPVTTSLRGPAGFQSLGFIPVTGTTDTPAT
jgi:hypothetical protein